MKTTTNTSSLTNYTLVNDTIQLRLNFNTEIYIQDDVKLRFVKNIIEGRNYETIKFYRKCSKNSFFTKR